MVNGMTPRNTKEGWKKAFEESEERNRLAVGYIQCLEQVCKAVLVRAAEAHAALDLVITPEGEKLKPVLADICKAVAPIAQDVEDMELSPADIAAIVGDGGKVVQMPQQGDEDADDQRQR